MEFDRWNTIQAREKLSNIHVVQQLGMFWLDFGRFFRGTWCKWFGVSVVSKGAEKNTF